MENNIVADYKMSAAIFCGGKSCRMGRDKALLPVAEDEKVHKSFLEQLTENLKEFDDLWLSIGQEESYPEVAVRKISDRYAGAGPMAGLESALTVCRHDILFVTAVDMPYVDRDLAEDLYDRLMEKPSLDALLMVDGQGRKQHLLGLYRKRILPVLTRRLEENQAGPDQNYSCKKAKDRVYRMRDFLEEIQVEYVPSDQVRLGNRKTVTCNTPEEYQALMGQVGASDITDGYTTPVPVISITGWSGSGKTTFLEKLLPCLKDKGLRVACLKHDAHHFEIDREGKDSYRLTRAGADMTGLFSSEKGVWMENRPVSLDQMLKQVHDVDLVLLEGGSETIYPRILVYREALGKGFRVEPEKCLAVISDDPVPGAGNHFGFEEGERLADFLADMCK